MKNKTIATWLAFLGGSVGLHRFYLNGLTDWLGWSLCIPTALGIYGIERVQQFGQDDTLSWLLIPLLGFTIAGCALCSIYFGLMSQEKWNKIYNPKHSLDSSAGKTSWITVGAIVLALLVGTTSLMASLAFSFQRYFEYQIQAAKEISQ